MEFVKGDALGLMIVDCKTTKALRALGQRVGSSLRLTLTLRPLHNSTILVKI